MLSRSNIKLKKETLSLQISKLIITDIQSGQLKPGEKLPSETALANKYGVSRTVIREAISSLKNEGLLESNRGRGLFVQDIKQRQVFRFSDVFTSVSINEIWTFFEMRAALESEAAALAALRRTDQEMLDIYNAFKGMEVAVETNALGAKEHNLFNSSITKASHNPIIIEFLSFIHVKLQHLAQELRVKTMLSAERASIVLEEHRTILKNIEAKDSNGAREAVLLHLKNAAQRANVEIYETES